MSWSDTLTRIRRLLRDPDANIWSEDYLRHIYNDVQQHFQQKTLFLEEVWIQRVPGLYHGAYLYDWEHVYLGSEREYQALVLHDDYCISYPWEAQEITGLTGDATDSGAHFTQPWEAYVGLTPGEPARVRWPSNCNSLKWAAYDERPVCASSRKTVQSADSSYITTQGTPTTLYEWDEDQYVLYPRPSSGFANELDGEGMALFADGDTEDTTSGTVAVRSTSFDAGAGMSVDIVDAADNLFLVYRASPTDMATAADEGDFPLFLVKYLIYGVVARAYAANTDGRIPSLGVYWKSRYELGISFTRRYIRNKRQDRDYRMVTPGVHGRSRRLPRLPDTYPPL
jgi:hypothetical protein